MKEKQVRILIFMIFFFVSLLMYYFSTSSSICCIQVECYLNFAVKHRYGGGVVCSAVS